ncbi:unnamed protein product [Ixodes persulcatus]
MSSQGKTVRKNERGGIAFHSLVCKIRQGHERRRKHTQDERCVTLNEDTRRRNKPLPKFSLATSITIIIRVRAT